MKNTNLISSSEKLKLEITIQNQKLWKDLDNIFCMLVLDLLSKITEDKNELKKSASILLTDDLYMKEINKKWRNWKKLQMFFLFQLINRLKKRIIFLLVI